MASRSLFFITSFTLAYIFLRCHAQSRTDNSPFGRKEQEIMASNMTSEEKFKATLNLHHRRYCRSSRTCLPDVTPDKCDYCAPCQCDNACFQNGDCCPDLLLQNQEQVAPFKAPQDCLDTLYRGYSTERHARLRFNVTRYFLVTNCPDDAPGSLRQACTNASLYLPVSARYASNHRQDVRTTVFANRFCALCHRVEPGQMTVWKMKIKCKEPRNFSLEAGVAELVRKASEDDTCIASFGPPHPLVPPPRQCYYHPHVVSKCNVTGAWPEHVAFLERACGTYLDPKVVDGVAFQNVFCYLCNADPGARETRWNLFQNCPNSNLQPMPFSALVDFTDVVDDVDSDRCLASQIYDDVTGQCRDVLCSRGRQYSQGNCTSVFGKARGLAYFLNLGMTPASDLYLTDANDLLHTLPMQLAAEIRNNLLNDEARWTKFVVTFDTTDPAGRCSDVCHAMSVQTALVAFDTSDQDDLEKMLLSARNTTLVVDNYLLNVTFTTHPRGGGVGGVWAGDAGSTPPGEGTTKGGNCAMTYSTRQSVLEGDEQLVYTPVNDLLLLPQVALRPDEFEVVSATRELKVAWREENLPPDRYLAVDGSIRIGLDDFLPKLEAYREYIKESDEAEVVLSVACTSLSLAGLAVTFLTYSALRPLRTVPGKNNMNLCAALFLAQLLYLVGSGRTEVPGVCQALAILMHYFWLAAFAAMSVCSFHMWRSFSSLLTSRDARDNHQRRVLQYTVFTWGASAAAVLLNLLMHLIVSGGERIGYGGQYCYLSTTLGIALAMGVPVALTVTANAVFFVLTVRDIRASPKVSKSRQDEQLAWVYLKLSTLTGITWTLAFLVFFTEVKFLEYIFTVVNALQGVFICISFVCNRRVGALCVACLKGDKSALATSSSTIQRTSSANRTETSFADNSVAKA